uniref:Uncharacterized protein n=1 Tax=Amphimedon queenslandica TaxID=400682 RepID=A0A1X7UNR5_AMPQE
MCAEECCLCYSNVSSGTLRPKRISINGNAAKVVMDVLNSLTLKFLGLKLSNRFNSQAFFCHKCRSMAEGFAALVIKLQSEETEFKEVIKAVLDKYDRGRKRQVDNAPRRRSRSTNCGIRRIALQRFIDLTLKFL